MSKGPILICDKSTLQGLGRGELNLLRKYYFLNIPPVLLAEILGDLKKHSDASLSREEVRHLAEKLVPACSVVNVHFKNLIRSELAGYRHSMNGRPVIGGGKYVIAEGNKKGMVFEESREAAALLRWQRCEFEKAEEILADAWRASTQSLDLEAMQRQLRPTYSRHLKLRTLSEVYQFVDDLIVSAPPDLLLSWFLREVGEDLDRESGVLARLRASQGAFQLIAPYTTHCLRAALIFHFALAFGLIGTRPTNRIDLEYLYYTPFCHAFSSGDVFHKKTAHLVLRKEQTFIEREELKSDLGQMGKWWAALGEQEREEETYRQGPPENNASVTHRLWAKVMKPGYRGLKRLSPDVAQRMFSEIKKSTDTCQPTGEPPNGSLDDCDFVVVKHHVRVNGPCICGSEKKFKECCGKNIVP